MAGDRSVKTVSLPEPQQEGGVPLEWTLMSRRSVRRFKSDPLSPGDVGQLLWAAQGVTDPRGYRTAPSAGALYPLEIRVLTRSSPDLDAGLYHYRPDRHVMDRVSDEDRREALSDAALNQRSVREAPAVFVITAVYERVTRKYGERGIRYTHMEAGHAAQNLLLQAVARELGGVPVGAFHDAEVARVVMAESREKALYIIPVGQPA